MTESDHVTVCSNALCWLFVWMDFNQIGRKYTWQFHIFIYTFFAIPGTHLAHFVLILRY